VDRFLAEHVFTPAQGHGHQGFLAAQAALVMEGATFSSLLEQVPRELATCYLTNPQQPLSEIAGVLGFSELSAFSRWFSQLFDCSPSSFRRFNAL
jgi:AraC-like DNA-binding protein